MSDSNEYMQMPDRTWRWFLCRPDTGTEDGVIFQAMRSDGESFFVNVNKLTPVRIMQALELMESFRTSSEPITRTTYEEKMNAKTT